MKALYVHVPFCDHICSYCDFCKVFYKESWADQYLDALQFEIQDKSLNQSFETIYIGGGTPSSLSYNQLENLLKILAPFSRGVKEYSIEVNPESMDERKLDLCIRYGINRLSIGVQTFHDDLLSYIHRYHSSKEAIQLIQMAKQKGFDDINVDLMYGLPQQKLDDVCQDISLIDQLGVTHVSVYSLILEDHTVLKMNDYQQLDDEQDAYWYQEINRCLKEHGFYHYEVSNYFKGKPSLHNLVYWHYEDYEGIGVSSHSLKNHCRYENTRSLTSYLRYNYLSNRQELSLEDEIFEKIMMGLRLTEGIDFCEFDNLYHMNFMKTYQGVIDKYVDLKMLEVSDTHLRTTALGMNYLNSILVDFMR